MFKSEIMKIFLVTFLKNNSHYSGSIDVPDIGFLLNSFVNASFRIIKNALTPLISEIWAKIFMDNFAGFFDKTPINEMFLN